MTTRITFSRVCVALLLLVSFSDGAFAQGRVNRYTITTPTLTWTDIASTGTTIITGTVGYGWRSYNFAVGLPFAFNYDNTTLATGTTMYINNDGLTFNS